MCLFELGKRSFLVAVRSDSETGLQADCACDTAFDCAQRYKDVVRFQLSNRDSQVMSSAPVPGTCRADIGVAAGLHFMLQAAPLPIILTATAEKMPPPNTNRVACV